MILHKLSCPCFNWKFEYWIWREEVTIHKHNTFELLKDGSARQVSEGLSGLGESWKGAIDFPQTRYDWPCLIFQAHIHAILDVPALKESSGKELRQLHDTASWHLRALKAMNHEPFGSFITSMLELKLDVNMTFEWQKHSQDSKKVPHFTAFLEFINL